MYYLKSKHYSINWNYIKCKYTYNYFYNIFLFAMLTCVTIFNFEMFWVFFYIREINHKNNMTKKWPMFFSQIIFIQKWADIYCLDKILCIHSLNFLSWRYFSSTRHLQQERQYVFAKDVLRDTKYLQ